MRWILCGKNDAAVQALEYAAGRGDAVWAIATAGDDGRDGWQRSFRAAAERLGVAVDSPRRINDPDFVARLGAYGADALVSIQYDQILRANLFAGVGCPCLNLHFALLPRHRGVAPIAWAILEGDREAGVTLHHMVEDIDAGDVLARRAVPIARDGTARELYDAVTRACVELFRASHPFPPELLATRLPQDPAAACYHRGGDFDFAATSVDWDQPAESLHRWLRAMIFPPLQHPETCWAGRALRVTRVGASLGESVTAPAGTVVAADEDGVSVAAVDRALRIRGLCEASGPGDAPSIHARLRPGDRLGPVPPAHAAAGSSA